MEGKKAVLVYNPASGKGKAKDRAMDFARLWQEKFGTELRLRSTRSLEDIRVAARETAGKDQIQIFMGGDGTLSESVQGLSETNDFKGLARPVGLLPGGTGNSFLRDFGITTYEEARDALLAAVAADSSMTIDAGIIEYQKCEPANPARGNATRRITFNIWGVGLISNITVTAIKMRFLGSFNYTLATVLKIFTHRPDKLKVTIDGKTEELFCNTLIVSNSRFTGGAMEMAPGIRVNDGQLFLVCPQFTSTLKLFSFFPTIFKGTHVNHPSIRTGFIKEIKVEREDPFIMNVDGELEIGYDPRLRVVPGYWKVFMPAENIKKASAK